MKTLLLLALALSLATCVNWAVLVAGSRSYSNYRHQADVYHNYQVLVKGGFDRSKIITMAVDDIANNPSNPFKGKVYNKPSYKDPGVDVYEGVKIDYSGNEVTPENFLAVLEGNSTATKGKKVLEITPQDNVFVFFSDHGSVGLIAFPYTYLYADKLLASLAKINGKYNKFVFYLEVPLLLYRLANQARCSRNFRLTLRYTPCLHRIPKNLRGAPTAVLTTWCRANISVHAWATSFQ